MYSYPIYTIDKQDMFTLSNFHLKTSLLFWNIIWVKRYWAEFFFSKASSFTLTFDNVTWKSIEVIYYLGAFTVPILSTLQQRGQEKLIERTSLGLQTDRQVQNNMLPFYKGGHKNMLQLESNCLQIHVSWA